MLLLISRFYDAVLGRYTVAINTIWSAVLISCLVVLLRIVQVTVIEVLPNLAISQSISIISLKCAGARELMLDIAAVTRLLIPSWHMAEIVASSSVQARA